MYKFLFILATSVILLSCEDSTTNSSTTSGDERTSSKIENMLHKHIAVLASDEFEGRAPATPGEEKTINYLRDTFAELGVGADLREIKRHKKFGPTRDEILNMIWNMEEEIMGRAEN